SGRPGQQRAGSEVPEEQAENSQGHKPGSVTHGQRGTEDQAEGWSGKPGVRQDTISRVRYKAEVGNGVTQDQVSGTEHKRPNGNLTYLYSRLNSLPCTVIGARRTSAIASAHAWPSRSPGSRCP
ncbi:unnamed protein product, partial [Staurois parvus]